MCIIDWNCQRRCRLTITRQLGERGTKLEEMTRLELMTLLLSLEALLEEGKNEKALEVIKEVLEEARKAWRKPTTNNTEADLPPLSGWVGRSPFIGTPPDLLWIHTSHDCSYPENEIPSKVKSSVFFCLTDMSFFPFLFRYNHVFYSYHEMEKFTIALWKIECQQLWHCWIFNMCALLAGTDGVFMF